MVKTAETDSHKECPRGSAACSSHEIPRVCAHTGAGDDSGSSAIATNVASGPRGGAEHTEEDGASGTSRNDN